MKTKIIMGIIATIALSLAPFLVAVPHEASAEQGRCTNVKCWYDYPMEQPQYALVSYNDLVEYSEV